MCVARESGAHFFMAVGQADVRDDDACGRILFPTTKISISETISKLFLLIDVNRIKNFKKYIFF